MSNARRAWVAGLALAVAGTLTGTVTSTGQAGAAAPALRITPSAKTVTAKVGGSVTVSYTLEAPARKREPLDVLFVVDTSMWENAPVFDSARAGLVAAAKRLATRPGVRIGLAEYRDLGDTEGTSTEQAAYRLRRRLSPPDAKLYDTIAALRSAGGGQPLGEAGTVALDQALYGDGHLGVVPPGGQAGFTPGRRAVVVVVAESAFATLPAYPDAGAVGEAYYDADIDVVGLVPTTTVRNRDAAEDAAGSVREIAWDGRSWDTIDCDDDGEPDVDQGYDLVCAAWLDPTEQAAAAGTVARLVPRLIDGFGLYSSVSYGTPKGMEPTEHEDEDGWTNTTFYIQGVYPTSPAYLNPYAPMRRVVRYKYTCPPGSRGKSFVIPLHAYLAGRGDDYVDVRNAAKTTLTCR
jgi:hypothetical protein